MQSIPTEATAEVPEKPEKPSKKSHKQQHQEDSAPVEEQLLDVPLDLPNLPVRVKDLREAPFFEKYCTEHEQKEVEEYENIYYLLENSKKIQPTKLERLVNNGFDDEEGYYRV